MEDLRLLLKKLVEANGPSGHEENVRKVVEEQLTNYVDEMKVDNLGNLICTKKGAKDSPKAMILAHTDEIGMLVRYIEKEGFIRFSYLGGFFDQIVLGQRVLIHTEKGDIKGVIGAVPPHLMPEKERKKSITREKMFIDIGAQSREQAEEWGVKIGSPITWLGHFDQLGNNMVIGKAFDDRAGCAIMIQTLKEVKAECTIIGVASVMEEVGLRGAQTSSYTVDADFAIALDITATGDHPGVEERQMPVKIGKGPAITVADGRRESLGGGLISHPKVLKLLTETAEKNNIPYQLHVFEGGTTDATAAATSRGGIPSATINVPTRYVHSPVEVLDLQDLSNAVKLLKKSLESAHRFF
ncbi:MAG: M42 family metallopeptidase [Candidatus Jordarchaeum sp.]|uniref:M42 family metallopeptidase n=1 Tax=Candidatus Jordarchaeum sp. TaxID=2823881 RepID=UPI004049F7D1